MKTLPVYYTDYMWEGSKEKAHHNTLRVEPLINVRDVVDPDIPRHPPGERCPAMGAICHNCQIKGHFKTQCRLTKPKRSMAGISTDQFSADDVFLGAVNKT